MSELSPEGGSEGYGAGSDEAAARLWSSWKARSCRASRACWTPENDLCAGDGGDHIRGDPAETQRSGFGGERRSRAMSELSPEGGSEGYGACFDERAMPQGSLYTF